MPQANKGVVGAAVILLVALFVWGLVELAMVPLETGDVYPPYSSLRSDPLGAKALYESLAALETPPPDLQVARLYKPRTQLAFRSDLLILGLDPISWDDITQKTLTGYEELVSKGGRLVFAFLPVHAPERTLTYPLLDDRWGLHFRYAEQPEQQERSSAIPRHSALYFDPGPQWRTIQKDGGLPSVIERPFGSGAIVLVAQSYPLSNEGLREARDAQSIAAILGPARLVLFDENHFGIEDTGSVTTLMRKYHLEPAIAVLLLTALLFLWRSASSLLPPRAPEQTQIVAGRDAQQGLVSLLERSLPEKDLLSTCYAEWSRTATGNRRANIVESEISRHAGAAPAEIYRAAARVLTQKNDRTTRATTPNH